MCTKGLYIFCRDLRATDNQSLHNFSKLVDELAVAFILNPRQVHKNKDNKNYFSQHALQLMCESLEDLHRQCHRKLFLLYGEPRAVISWVLDYDRDICMVGTHADYSHFAIKRNQDLETECLSRGVTFWTFADDLTLAPLNELCKADGSGYKKFSSFYENVRGHKVSVLRAQAFHFVSLRGLRKLRQRGILKPVTFLSSLYTENKDLAQRGGRTGALRTLRELRTSREYYKEYAARHNDLDYETLNVSGFLNFGCVSVREVYRAISNALGTKSELLKQLWWRDFFLQALVFLKDGADYNYMDRRYRKIRWRNSRADWNKIIAAETGYLIVDAGMRQMLQTGYMHNRARMIVGHFWTKYCLIDTFHKTYGSQVGYSKYLVDAVGCSQNKMNQQWITEFDYSGKKFAPKNNPLAGRPMDVSNKACIKKFDPDCVYIKRWLPELADIENSDLINWSKEKYLKYKIHAPPMFPDAKKKYKDWLRAAKKAGALRTQAEI